jgi:hypothetical protein
LIRNGVDYKLTEASAARVDALLAYVYQNRAVFARRGGTVVFSGGWAGAGQNLEKPPERFREGSLMQNRASVADFDGSKLAEYVETFAEVESDSTLENVLEIQAAKYFHGTSFTARNRLGLVAHKEHLKRTDYLVRSVFKLPLDAVFHIVAPGVDKTSSGVPESLILQVTRLSFAGAGGTDALRRRQRILVGLNRALSATVYRRR